MRISDWSSDVCSSDLEPFLARDDERGLGAQLFERLGIDGRVIGARDADQLARDMRGIGERPHQVEDRAAADLAADGGDPLHRRVVVGGEQEGDAEIGECRLRQGARALRSEEHTSELQSLMRTSYAVFCLNTKKAQYK